MHKKGTWFTGLLALPMFLLGISSVEIQVGAASRTVSPAFALQSEMFQNLQNLAQQLSVDHTVHWKHTAPGFGEVITSMSVAPTNFDGCSVVWSQTQEGTRPGELFYVETHRFEVPLSSMDAKQITVEPVAAGQSARPGVEAGDYYSVVLHSSGGKNTVNMVDHNITFNQKKGPIASVQQLMVSSAWVRVRQAENGQTLKTDFQQAIASCIVAGQ